MILYQLAGYCSQLTLNTDMCGSTTLRLLMVVLTLLLGLVLADSQSSQCRHPLVAVTVSPLVSSSSIRSLEVSWSLEPLQSAVYVALHLTQDLDHPIFTAEVNTSSGWLDTGIQQNRSSLETLAFTEVCLGYWAALHRRNDSQVLASSCLGTEPRWMEQNRAALQNLTLRGMFLPGTHNSAAYLESHEPFHETTVQKYVFNQDERVLNQLIYGARVLDLRVGHYPESTERWWANHGVARLRPLSEVLTDVLLFVNMTKEIVVLDFHHFPVGFHEAVVHQALLRYLEEYLEGYLVLPSLGWGAPLDNIWRSGKRLILSYNYQGAGSLPSQYRWPRVVHKWGNVRSVASLRAYLSPIIKRENHYPWSAMVQLTASVLDVLTGRLGSLRQMAHLTNHNVTDWFREDWGSSCNIVSVDFIRSSGIVRAAVDWNLRRAKGSRCDL